MSRIDETIQAKIEKRRALEKKGVLVHPYSFDKKNSIQQCRDSIGESVQTAGRILSLRTHGKLNFLDLQDDGNRIQVMLREGDLTEDQLSLIPLIDPGDYLGVAGSVMTSKSGEVTIMATQIAVLGKALRPIPTSWNIAEDKEVRFRKRYLDMMISAETKKVLDARWLIEKEVRRYLQDEHDFTEVETPVFQPLYGGTNAKPFSTHMNALDTDFYLRLAPELYLKRLIVGGYEKIFEIARNFRNEGIDQTHQPEFTMIEWYEAYADYFRMMDVAEGLFKHVANKLHGNLLVQVNDLEIDLGGVWPRIVMKDAIKQYLDIDFDAQTDQQLLNILSENKLEVAGDFTRGKAQFAIFDKLVAKDLINPTWIIDYPRDISPLAKQHRSNPELAERFELYVGGKELADGWSEITDALDQRQLFENEQQRMREGDDEAHPLDEDFLESMEYGMPPLGGIGVGIDRLVMFLTNTWSIREVIAFPTLRPLRKLAVQSGNATQKEHSEKSAPQAEKMPTTQTDQQLINREQTIALMHQHIQNAALRHHVEMVANAMEAYAKNLGEDPELWYATGLLHDLDWEMYPDEHPNKAIVEMLSEYPQIMKDAIAAHAPDRTGRHPETTLDKYMFACDELSGLMHAYSLMRPTGFAGMEVKSVKKKIKDKAFAANVSRDDIARGFELIGKTPEEHIAFLIEVFNKL